MQTLFCSANVRRVPSGGQAIALQPAAVDFPLLQNILKTVSPSPMEWLVVAAASLSPALLVELYKLRAAKG
jgi:hypothetical protein